MPRRLKWGFAAALLALALLGISSQATPYTFKTLDLPGAPRDINAQGDIVGFFNSGGVSHGYLYTGGDVIRLDRPGAWTTAAYGINDAGEIVGDAAFRGYRYLNGVYQDYVPPGRGGLTGLTGINNNGTVVGNINYLSGRPPLIVGFVQSSTGFEFIYRPDTPLVDFAVWGINDHDQIVGHRLLQDGTRSSFLFAGGGFSTIVVPGASGTLAYGINNGGDVVGTFVRDGTMHGFIGYNYDYTTIDVPGATGTWVYGVNDLGVVVGQYSDASGGLHSFIATPELPEPGTLALFGSALLIAARLRRRDGSTRKRQG